MAGDRDHRALQLRQGGMSVRQVATTMGYPDTKSAREAIQRAQMDEGREDIEESRQTELARLDFLTRTLMRVLATKHYVTSATGAVVRDPETREPLIDDGPSVMAARELRMVSERRSRMLGLDAATRHEITMDQIDSKIAELEAQLAKNPDRRAINP